MIRYRYLISGQNMTNDDSNLRPAQDFDAGSTLPEQTVPPSPELVPPSAVNHPSSPIQGFPAAPQPQHVPLFTPHIPPLSIRYVMAWTAVTAVILAVLTRAFGATPGAGVPVVAVLLLALAATALGWIYCGTLLIGWHAAQRRLWPLEPGEWLILFLANAFAVWGVMAILDDRRWVNLSWREMEFLAKLIPGQFALVLVSAAVAQRHQGIFWRWLFAASAILMLSIYLPILAPGAVREVARGLSQATTLLIGASVMGSLLGLMIAGVVRDRLQRLPRHWLHWSGVSLVGLCLLFYFGTIAIALAWRLTRGWWP
ncbi:MAG: hypothetical protein K8T91_16670 [Planctomycetes bacterium]|nr:hypothetical protein [Planctomycetota bacterium]